MQKEEVPEIIRQNYISYSKWLVSLSTFFITFSFTILTFKEGIKVATWIMVSITLICLLINIFFSWRLIKVFLKLPFVAFKKDNQLESFAENILKKITFFYKWQTTSFIIGFIFFIIFLISIVL